MYISEDTVQYRQFAQRLPGKKSSPVLKTSRAARGWSILSEILAVKQKTYVVILKGKFLKIVFLDF